MFTMTVGGEVSNCASGPESGAVRSACVPTSAGGLSPSGIVSFEVVCVLSNAPGSVGLEYPNVGNFNSKFTHMRNTSRTRSLIDGKIVGVLVNSVTAVKTSFHEKSELLDVFARALSAACSAADLR